MDCIACMLYHHGNGYCACRCRSKPGLVVGVSPDSFAPRSPALRANNPQAPCSARTKSATLWRPRPDQDQLGFGRKATRTRQAIITYSSAGRTGVGPAFSGEHMPHPKHMPGLGRDATACIFEKRPAGHPTINRRGRLPNEVPHSVTRACRGLWPSEGRCSSSDHRLRRYGVL